MLNIFSILIGLLGGLLAIIGLVPFLGWTNWIWLIVPVIGAIVGAISKEKSGLTLNLVVIAIMAVRLSIGGGII